MRILLIGTHTEALKWYARLLRKRGHEVSIESDGTDHHQFDLVAHLWPMSAYQLNKRLQKCVTMH